MVLVSNSNELIVILRIWHAPIGSFLDVQAEYSIQIIRVPSQAVQSLHALLVNTLFEFFLYINPGRQEGAFQANQ